MNGTIKLPASLIANPRLDRWLNFNNNRTLRVATGKVEIGQGIVTALSQIAAEELNLSLERLIILSGSTEFGPDERYTSSSLSVMVSGASIRLVCAEVRYLLTEQAALRLNCAPSDLDVVDGAFVKDGVLTGLDYWDVAPAIDFSRAPTGIAQPKPPEAYRIVGQDVPRADLPAKITGAAGTYLHDLYLEGTLHARTLRQPAPHATLKALDEEVVRRASGDPALRIVRRANFAAFVSTSERSAEAAAIFAEEYASWSDLRSYQGNEQEGTWLIGRPAELRTFGAPDANIKGGADFVEATYTRPYIAHASMGPSAAIAQYDGEIMTVWSHGQGMHPLGKNIADMLGLDPKKVVCHHRHGPGCYGHNGADDAAADAALVAQMLPHETIRLQWRREEEFAYEPVSPAMSVTVKVTIDDSGNPMDWTQEIWSATHVQRPGSGSGYLLASEALENPPPPVKVTDPEEERGGGGTRNAVPLYRIPAHRIKHHLVTVSPVRTSALRGLGAPTNVFAMESMIDELATRADRDPLKYRLTLLDDLRARAVLEKTAQMASWEKREFGGDGKGLGIAFARYKNMAAYSAVAVAVTVADEVRLDHVWSASDAGLVVNPDGARNQLEGGIIQAASFALKEQVKLEGEGISSRNWDAYPILRFSEVPTVDVELIGSYDDPSLGIGECTVGPTCAAIGNAVAHALGRRMYHMPLNRERIISALLS
ncbi:MAG: Nicotinate dehydrogenase subunit B [Alphaproteobacteria bacterium MarineAlpha4_Bin2]|nr:MAG: Nicotinate dehydrogenase subunit B [Alphaproteobacteria bacterium MarineAlpha4_Bin2]